MNLLILVLYCLRVFNWNLSDSKSHQFSRTFLSILADLNNAVVKIVSARSTLSNSSSTFTKLLRIVPSAPITIGITLTFMFHGFFFVLWQGLSTYFFFSLYLNLPVKSIRFDSYSRKDTGIIRFQFLLNYQWIIFPTNLYMFLNSI